VALINGPWTNLKCNASLEKDRMPLAFFGLLYSTRQTLTSTAALPGTGATRTTSERNSPVPCQGQMADPQRDFQAISECVFAMTAKAHALGRYVDGHGLFKPRNSFRMNAHWNRERFPHAASPFVFSMRVSIGSGALAFFQNEWQRQKSRGHQRCRWRARVGQFCGKLPRRVTFSLSFFARIRGPNDLKHFSAANNLGSHFWLSVAKRSVVRKSDPHARSARMCFFHGTSRPLRETSMVCANSIFWPKGAFQRKRTGRRKRTRRCWRLSIGVTVLPVSGDVSKYIPEYQNRQDLVLGQKSLIFALQFVQASVRFAPSSTAQGVLMSVGADRREARRFTMSLPMRVSPRAKGRELDAHTRDVSYRGLYFVTDADFEVGSELNS